MRASKKILRAVGAMLAALLLVLEGCNLPFPGPFQGTVTDAETGKPISGAKVEAEWWCHDNPIPDSGGSFFVRSSTLTDEQGAFRIAKERRRGGFFGSSLVLKISATGYIPANVFAMPSGDSLPQSTTAYPFIQAIAYEHIPPTLHVKLRPAGPVLLQATKSGEPLHRKVAREKLTKLLGVDYKYDSDKWEQALKSGRATPERLGDRRESSKRAGCSCPESVDKSKRPKEVRRKVRKLLNAAASSDMREVEDLLSSGVDANSRNYACRTALMKASFMGNYAVVNLLLSKGADANLRDDNCRTALLHAAARYEGSDMVQALLAHGADVNAADKDGMTALMEAAQFGHSDTVRVLLSHGAAVNIMDKDDETAWFKAAVGARKEVMEMLESHGAKVK